MKWCLVGPGYPPDAGGAEEYLKAMAERLAKKGHEVHALVFAQQKPGEETLNGVHVHRLQATWFGSKRLAWLAGLEEKIREINPSLVHVQSHASLYSLQAADACQRLGKKFVVLTYGPTVEHNPGGFLRNGFAQALDALTVPRLFCRAEAVLYRAANVETWCRSQGARKLVHASTGIDEAFLAMPAQERRPECLDRKVIGFVGALSQRKGARHLLEAFARVLKTQPTALLVFVGGEGEKGFKETLETMARRHGIRTRVLFTGNVDTSTAAGKKELIQWIDSFDVFCLPSAWEGPSQAMLQAMARGKPVVVAWIPTLDGLVSKESSAVVAFGDVKGLATVLTELLTNSKQREQAGTRNKAIAARYTFDRLAVELEKACLELV
ncbi:MAG: glycosyltransferase family 4 protein [Candidatus Diapherotrites archaeon]|uniref:Glycosyltransferase family 4 protein n=1 Tax=Candidatus Iainarchaeum sp. TaxID=3101447 RepID=A0A8T4L9Y5_9ARCH|nr:glycosyltransferase family 4 protein [Candidatus Diapherotrites archaeon]